MGERSFDVSINSIESNGREGEGVGILSLESAASSSF